MKYKVTIDDWFGLKLTHETETKTMYEAVNETTARIHRLLLVEVNFDDEEEDGVRKFTLTQEGRLLSTGSITEIQDNTKE